MSTAFPSSTSQKFPHPAHLFSLFSVLSSSIVRNTFRLYSCNNRICHQNSEVTMWNKSLVSVPWFWKAHWAQPGGGEIGDAFYTTEIYAFLAIFVKR